MLDWQSWSEKIVSAERQEAAMGVLGIGGLFFRARDPEALTTWYREDV